MKITGHAGHGNTFTEININGPVQFCPEVREVVSVDGDDQLSLGQVICALSDAGDRFTTWGIPIKLNGKSIKRLNINICQDKEGNHYIDIKEH